LHIQIFFAKVTILSHVKYGIKTFQMLINEQLIEQNIALSHTISSSIPGVQSKKKYSRHTVQKNNSENEN
jgi:hypothetical protein